MKKFAKYEEWFFKGLMYLSTLSIGLVLFVILFSVLYTGLPYLSWEMISSIPEGGYYYGKSGGILNAIIGSLYLSLGSTALAFIVGMPLAMFMNIHLVRNTKFVSGIRFILDLLWGVPSIVYGAFAFTIMIYFGLKTSLLAGIVTVSLFILPIVVRAIDEVLMTVPRGLFESALSLGSTKSEIAYRIMFKQCFPGIITAILLSFGRGIGDAASILFTTGYTDYIPTSLGEQTATLPLAIFFQLSSPIPEVRGRAYAASIILILIILIISLLSRYFTKRYEKNKINF
ncbi:MAG: ABC transporter permease subunit [Lentimicrobiaceae bacterium]|jgi:phosphate transport system permease protein|nr:ABC transporter permease subunit [Lentimicrobiaceae bacterium]